MNGSGLNKCFETIQLLCSTNVSLEEGHMFLSNNPDPRLRYKDENNNEHQVRRAMSIVLLVITSINADKTNFPAKAGHMDFIKSGYHLLDCITNLASKYNEKTIAKEL